MRIITGTRARASLIGPKDLRRTRPITDRVKESLFSILTPKISGAIVADIFCGTGSLGLEALSRDAKCAIFVERERDAVARLRQNIEKLRFQNTSIVVQTDAFKTDICTLTDRLRTILPDFEHPKYDLVFVDPPYRDSVDSSIDSPLGVLLAKLSNSVSGGGIAVVRHERKGELLLNYSNLNVYDRREYGNMAITFLENTAEGAPS